MPKPDSPRRFASYAPLLSAVLVILVYDIRVLLAQGVRLDPDTLLLFYPSAHALHGSLRAGTLPFWVPDLQFGFPLMAEGQFSATYLPNLLTMALFSTPVGYGVLLVAHNLLALLFGFVWGRTLRLSTLASTAVGLVFALIEPARGLSMPMMETFIWTPLLFALTERHLRQRSPWAAWPVALVVGLQWTAGFPQYAFYAALAVALYLLLRLAQAHHTWPERLRLGAGWFGAAALGGLLAMPQLLPTFQLSGYSIRAGGIEGSLSSAGSLFPAGLITFVLPALRGFFSQTGLGTGGFIGIVPLVLAVSSLLNRELRRRTLPLWILAGVFTILAFGRYQPLYFILRRLPGFSSFRVASRFILFTQFALITLMGYAIDALLTARPRPIDRKVGLGLALCLALVVVSVFVAHPLLQQLESQILSAGEWVARRFILNDPYHLQSWAYYENKLQQIYVQMLQATDWRHRENLLVLLIAATGWLFTRLGRARKSRFVDVAWANAVWSGLVIVELLAFGGWTRPVDSTALVTEPPPTASMVQAQADSTPFRSFWLTDESSIVPGDHSARLLAADYNLLFDIPSTGVYAALGFRSTYTLMADVGTINLAFGLKPISAEAIEAWHPLLDFLNVRYVLSRVPLDGFELLGTEGDVYLYRNATALPRVQLMDRVAVVETQDQGLSWVKENPTRLGEMAAIEGRLPTGPEAGAAADSTAEITHYAPTRVDIEVSAAGDVLLLLTDSFYPGWDATVDGDGTPIFRADGTFRAVWIPRGAHQVAFTYTPRAFRAGLALSAVGALGVLLAAVLPERVRARRQRSTE